MHIITVYERLKTNNPIRRNETGSKTTNYIKKTKQKNAEEK